MRDHVGVQRFCDLEMGELACGAKCAAESAVIALSSNPLYAGTYRVFEGGPRFIYTQSDGVMDRVSADGEDVTLEGTGYAGKGAGLNNPYWEYTADQGPLPSGEYAIGEEGTHSYVDRFGVTHILYKSMILRRA